MKFILNKTLKKDTHLLKDTNDYYLLLNKNALVTWLILVPKTNKVELFECNEEFKSRIQKAIDYYAKTLNLEIKPDKMNIASIGNVVPQLHIHIIARFKNDFAWPDPIWGKSEKKEYKKEQLVKLIELF